MEVHVGNLGNRILRGRCNDPRAQPYKVMSSRIAAELKSTPSLGWGGEAGPYKSVNRPRPSAMTGRGKQSFKIGSFSPQHGVPARRCVVRLRAELRCLGGAPRCAFPDLVVNRTCLVRNAAFCV